MLKKILIGATALLSFVSASAAASGANAYPWHGYGYRGPGVAVGAGLLGVAVGASLARPYYGPPPAYYAGPGYWAYYDGCRTYWRWDPYAGRYLRDVRCY
jgi:hypothetical protein